MIRHAEKLNRFPDKLNFHLNVRPDLATFPAGKYDFICSLIALQHTPPEFQRAYLADFYRLLAPGGCAFFQTIHARGIRRLVPNWVADGIRKWRSKGQAFIPLYGQPVDHILSTFNRDDCRVVKFESAGYPGWESRYSTDVFIVRKDPVKTGPS